MAQSIAKGFAIEVLGVFLILSFQFRIYIEPLFAIPLALRGSIWGHVLMGYDISLPSLIGAASLYVVLADIGATGFNGPHATDGVTTLNALRNKSDRGAAPLHRSVLHPIYEQRATP